MCLPHRIGIAHSCQHTRGKTALLLTVTYQISREALLVRGTPEQHTEREMVGIRMVKHSLGGACVYLCSCPLYRTAFEVQGR